MLVSSCKTRLDGSNSLIHEELVEKSTLNTRIKGLGTNSRGLGNDGNGCGLGCSNSNGSSGSNGPGGLNNPNGSGEWSMGWAIITKLKIMLGLKQIMGLMEVSLGKVQIHNKGAFFLTLSKTWTH